MPQIGLANAISGLSVAVMTVATAFMGVSASKTYDLAEQFGRIDAKVTSIDADVKSQLDLLKSTSMRLDNGFDEMSGRFDRIDLRIGQMELDPEFLLSRGNAPLEKDLHPVFFDGSIYVVAVSPAAEQRMKSAGYERAVLGGFLPAYLILQDAFLDNSGRQ